jgi:hypothetical protein
MPIKSYNIETHIISMVRLNGLSCSGILLTRRDVVIMGQKGPL